MTKSTTQEPQENDEVNWRFGWPLKLAAAVFFLIVVCGISFAVFEPIQVLPRIRLAPGYALTTHDSEVVTSETARGAITLYSFAPTDCDRECESSYETMAEVALRVNNEVDLGSTEFRQVTIALDADPTASELRHASQRSGADDNHWQWVGGTSVQLRNVVGSGFKIFYEQDSAGETTRFDPGFVLVDGAGIIRGEYRYQTLATDADKIVHHVDILANEIRNANGATAVAYEAAHLFLCYP